MPGGAVRCIWQVRKPRLCIQESKCHSCPQREAAVRFGAARHAWCSCWWRGRAEAKGSGAQAVGAVMGCTSCRAANK